MWFKKKSQISGYNPNTAVDGTDWRTSGNNSSSWSASYILPDAADAGNYFFLPALGYYVSGRLYFVGYFGYYWSSSAYPLGSGNAYRLSFHNNGYIAVLSYPRFGGLRAEALQ